MTAHAVVEVKNSAGEVIGTFRQDLPERPIFDTGEMPDTKDRYVTDPSTGYVYAVGLGAVYVGIAAATVAPAPAQYVPGPESDYREGDWVRFVEDAHSAVAGTVGRVRDELDEDGDIGVRYAGDWDYFKASDIEPHTYRVGDLVRITAQGGHALEVGADGTVTSVSGRLLTVTGKRADNGRTDSQFITTSHVEPKIA